MTILEKAAESENVDACLEACAKGDLAALQNFLNLGFDIERQNSRGWNPLIVSAFHGKLALVELLLSRGANPNSKNFKGTSALMYAKTWANTSGEYEIVQRLLEAGAEINARDCYGKTVLAYILDYHNFEMEQYFTKRGAIL